MHCPWRGGLPFKLCFPTSGLAACGHRRALISWGPLGHKTLKMTKRYAHLSPGYMQNVAGKLDVAFKGVLPEIAGD
jgi:hypothetical protein